MHRRVLAVALGVGLMLNTMGTALAQDEPQPFTVNGTVLRMEGGQAEFLTADITGEEKIVWLDVSELRDLNGGRVANFEPNETIQVLLLEKPDGVTFWALQYEELAKGSMVNNTDWGVSEAYTTRDDSINARVDNGPDDDEARSQGNKFDESGNRQKEDDD